MEGSGALLAAAIASREGPEEEPRLKYAPLGSESPRATDGLSTATRLGVSEKVLAVGDRDGRVHLLSHLGDQVRCFKEHSAEVTDLCFDASAEFLASASCDGTVAVYGLYSDEVQRFKFDAPVMTVALDPRYGARKTREVVYGTSSGVLALCSKGWLGNKETALFQGTGPVHCARMSGTLLAWATDSGLRVYDTSTHTRLGKLDRPAGAAADPGAPCSLLWRSERELLVGWGRHVWVLRVSGSLLPAGPPAGAFAATAAAARSLQIVASFDAACPVLGAAQFGAELALLTWGTPGSSGGAGSGTAADKGTAAAAAAEAEEQAEAEQQPEAVLHAGGWTSAEEQGASGDTATPADAVQAHGEAGPAPGAALADGAARGAGDAASAGNAAAGQGAAGRPVDAAGSVAAASAAVAAATAAQQDQPLCLSFYSRGGRLLACDALGSRCGAADRRWHQLALLYSGDADLKLAEAAAAGGPAAQSLAAGSASFGPQRAAHAADSDTATPEQAPSGAGAAQGCVEPALLPAEQRAQSNGVVDSSSDGAVDAAAAAAAVQQYKWWRDGEEPMYLVSAPLGIVVGKPRDGNDRVAWLAERGRYTDALTVAEEDSTVQAATLAAVGERFLGELLQAGRYGEAAALCPRVLKGGELAWERWVYTFAQHRRLAALAPLLPTSTPRLKRSTYDMVAAALLVHPADHEVLLQIVHAWPPSIYDAAALQAAVLSRMGGAASSWPVLQRVAAHLFTAQGRHEDALRVQLQLRSPTAFEYIARHALVDRLAPHVAALVELDEVRATTLLAEHSEEVPPGAVVAALQDAASRAEQGEHRRRWRRCLHHYLDTLFQKDSQAAPDFAELQLELYAEFEPSRLLHFLMVCPSYPLEQAYQVCEARGLTREMVYVLGRMGSAEKALRLIVEGLRDVAQAVEFVQLQRDDELWEQLIALTLGDAQLTGALLDHAGGYIDPLRVVSQIPQHLKVDNLRGRLVKIIADFRTQMSLQQGCNTILRHDCIVLANRLYRLLRSALRRLHLRMHSQGGAAKWVLYDCRSGAEVAGDATHAALLAGPSAAASQHSGSPEPAPWPARGSAKGPGTPQRDQHDFQLQQQQQHASHQQQQRRVWVGFLGGQEPPAGGEAQQHLSGRQHAQHAARSPSKFARPASGGPSPAKGPPRSPGPSPQKLLVS